LVQVHSDRLAYRARRWAVERADFRNSVFRPEVPWTAEEILGLGDRKARIAENQVSQFALMKQRRALANIHSGSKPEDIEGMPEWARAKGKGPGGGWSQEEIARAFGNKG